LLRDYGERAVRPVLIAPDQTEGDLTLKPALPNAARVVTAKKTVADAPAANWKRPAFWKPFFQSSTFVFFGIAALVLAPFFNFVPRFGNRILDEAAVTATVVLLAVLLACFVPVKISGDRAKLFALAAVFGVGGAIASLIQRLLFASVNPSEFVEYSANGEIRVFGGCVAVAVVLQRLNRLSFPLLQAIGIATIIIYARYVVFLLNMQHGLFSNISTLVYCSFALPPLLIGLLMLSPGDNKNAWLKDVAVVLAVPVLLYAVIIANIPIDFGLSKIGLFNAAGNSFAGLLLWLFVIPMAWTWPALLARRPNFARGVLARVR